MKYISTLAILAALQLNSMAQSITEANVPTVIKSNFSTMYANTTVTKWELEDGNYEATYLVRGLENSVIFSADGQVVLFISSITANEIPEAARNYIVNNLSGKKIGTLTRNKTITGEATYAVQAADKYYIFDVNGNFLKVKDQNDAK